MSDDVASITAQNWPWHSQIADKKWYSFSQSLFFFIACVCYYLIFNLNKLFRNFEKRFLFHLKSYFAHVFKFLLFFFFFLITISGESWWNNYDIMKWFAINGKNSLIMASKIVRWWAKKFLKIQKIFGNLKRAR